MLRAAAALFLSVTALSAQQAVDTSHLYHRVLARVPMVGKGTFEDPKRPMFAPAPGDVKPGDRSGIIAYQFQMSDDGQTALVEFVAADKVALQTLLSSKDVRVKTFEVGKDSRAAIESDFKSLKRDFSLDSFRPTRVQ